MTSRPKFEIEDFANRCREALERSPEFEDIDLDDLSDEEGEFPMFEVSAFSRKFDQRQVTICIERGTKESCNEDGVDVVVSDGTIDVRARVNRPRESDPMFEIWTVEGGGDPGDTLRSVKTVVHAMRAIVLD